MPGVEQFKATFFDSPKVLRAVDRAMRRQLSKFGAFVRRRQKSSIRKRKRVSAPGSPPSSHSGLLRQFIFFGYEHEKKAVVSGPALLNGRRSGGVVPASGTIPELLEYGGAARIIRPRRPARSVYYRPRPSARPARDAELPKFLASLKDSVR
jgi:hypothetical protein